MSQNLSPRSELWKFNLSVTEVHPLFQIHKAPAGSNEVDSMVTVCIRPSVLQRCNATEVGKTKTLP